MVILNMNKYSKVSKERLSTCDSRLQDIFNELIKELDCSIICGFRGEEEQNKAFYMGKSKAIWGKSKHNKRPSLAVDAAPYPIDWNNHVRFVQMNDKIQAIAKRRGIKIKWGGAFKSFKDLSHWELV